MIFVCPVCFFDQLRYPAADYNICPCCGTEFENDDVEYSYDELRTRWIANGAEWFDGDPPANWSPWAQLASHSFGVLTGAVTAANTVDVWSGDVQEYSVA